MFSLDYLLDKYCKENNLALYYITYNKRKEVEGFFIAKKGWLWNTTIMNITTASDPYVILVESSENEHFIKVVRVLNELQSKPIHQILKAEKSLYHYSNSDKRLV